MCVTLKQGMPEMDDFERNPTLIVKEKYWNKVFKDTLPKTSQNIFAYSFVSTAFLPDLRMQVFYVLH